MTFPTQLSSTHAALLWSLLPSARIASFLSESQNGNMDEALELCIWSIIRGLVLSEGPKRLGHDAAGGYWCTSAYLQRPIPFPSDHF